MDNTDIFFNCKYFFSIMQNHASRDSVQILSNLLQSKTLVHENRSNGIGLSDTGL